MLAFRLALASLSLFRLQSTTRRPIETFVQSGSVTMLNKCIFVALRHCLATISTAPDRLSQMVTDVGCEVYRWVEKAAKVNILHIPPILTRGTHHYHLPNN